jgi:hypothetical protein
MDEWPCPHCGESLLGAANRCWKCGGRVQPPVSNARASQPSTTTSSASDVIVASVAEAATDSLAQDQATPVLTLLTRQEIVLALATEPPRRGSPFAAIAPLSQHGARETVYGAGPYDAQSAQLSQAIASQYQAPLAANYPQHTAAMGGVVASLILGILSLGLLFYSALAALIAVAGAIAGIWGLKSERRNLAILGILLCCLAMTLGGYRVGFALYQQFFPATTVTLPGAGF